MEPQGRSAGATLAAYQRPFSFKMVVNWFSKRKVPAEYSGNWLKTAVLKIDVNWDSRDSDLFPVCKMRFADAARSFAFSLRTKTAFAPYITIAPCALRAGWKGTAPLSGAGEQTPRANAP